MENNNLLQRAYTLILGFGAICFIIFAAKMIFSSNIFNFSIGDNLLEKATIVGSSTRNDFEIFQREGGLEIENIWNEFYVESVSTSYSDSEVLKSVTFRLDKKGYQNLYGSIDANYTNITDNIDEYCGSNWKKQNEFEKVYESESQGYYCKYEYPSSSSSVYVTISESEGS